MLAMAASNEALRYVSFPTQVRCALPLTYANANACTCIFQPHLEPHLLPMYS